MMAVGGSIKHAVIINNKHNTNLLLPLAFSWKFPVWM